MSEIVLQRGEVYGCVSKDVGIRLPNNHLKRRIVSFLRCDVGLKTTRDRKVITCSWTMFWNTEFTYGSISFDEKDLMLVMEGHATWFRVPNVYQHALKADKDNFLAWRRKNAIMVSERDKRINQSRELNSQLEA
ncbi:hypothetical protein GQ457_17G004750 [Hibiscus cannabinus]